LLTFLGLIGDAKYVTPLSPLGLHHIWYANIIALGLYTAVSFLLFTRHGTSVRGRAFLCCFLPLATLCLLLSASRSAWLGSALTALIMTAIQVKSKKTVLLVVLCSALAGTLAYRFVPVVHDRIGLVARDLERYSENKYADSSTGSRFMMWRATALMVKGHPLVGVGTGDFEYTMNVMRRQLRTRVVPVYLLRFNQPHNMYLFSMATNGIAGLAALLFIFYRILHSVAPVVRSEGGGNVFAFLALATAVHFMIAGLFDSFFNIQILRYAFVFIMGVCIRSSVNGARRP
jgi:O-antigen ligase